MAANRIRIGTRKSAMALAQTEEITRRLIAAAPSLDVEIVKFETTGDTDQVGKLLPHGGKGGAFVAEIRNAVLSGQLQAAMHSLKDMPGNEDTPGLVIGATLSRDPPGDVLVLRPGVSLDELKRTRGKGFKIGTNAVRRAAYARRLFPDIEVIHFRGAADTRVRKLDHLEKQRLPNGGAVGPADALIMARSGLERVGLADRIAYGAGDRRGRMRRAGLVNAADPLFDRRSGRASMRRRRARSVVGAQRPLQFADRWIFHDQRCANVAVGYRARSCRRRVHRSIAFRARRSAARTRPRRRARVAAKGRG
jgi:hypothetical protein